MTNEAGRSSRQITESSLLQRAFIATVMLIFLSCIISGASAKSNPRIYWNWPENPIEKAGSNADIDVYYVSDDNEDTGMLDRATMGAHDYEPIPWDSINNSILIKLETKPDELKINGENEHDFQITMGDFSYTFYVAPQKPGNSKLQLEYSIDGKNFVKLTPAIKISVVD
jgi:hypothetical protein